MTANGRVVFLLYGCMAITYFQSLLHVIGKLAGLWQRPPNPSYVPPISPQGHTMAWCLVPTCPLVS